MPELTQKRLPTSAQDGISNDIRLQAIVLTADDRSMPPRGAGFTKRERYIGFLQSTVRRRAVAPEWVALPDEGIVEDHIQIDMPS